MKTRTTLCTLMCILLPLSAQALPSLSHIFPCLRKHTRTTVVHIPAPTLAQRCLKFSKTIAQSKITKAAVATTILCICAKKAWDYVQSWRAQLRNTSEQLRTESTRNQELQQQNALQAEQLAQAQQQAQEHQQETERLTQNIGQLQQQSTMLGQTTQQALEALQARIDSLPLRAAERLNAQGKRLTRLDQQLQQLKDALTHKAQASRLSSKAKGKTPAGSSSHLTRARVYASQAILPDSRINQKIKPDIPHFHNSRHCEACERRLAQSTSPASH